MQTPEEAIEELTEPEVGTSVQVGSKKTNGDDIPDVLYHYTNKKGHDAILDSGELNPSIKAHNPKDARYGDGQYLSDIVPGTTSPTSLALKFLRVPNRYNYTHYIGIDTTGLDVKKGRDGVYVIPNDIPLDISNRVKSHGSVCPAENK